MLERDDRRPGGEEEEDVGVRALGVGGGIDSRMYRRIHSTWGSKKRLNDARQTQRPVAR